MQIRIVHRIIGTNVILQEMGIVDNHNCSFCSEEKDSITHMFWRCKFITEFWISLEEILKRKCEAVINLHLTENIVLFGTEAHFESDTVFDFIILLAKQYIYRCKTNQCRPLTTIFMKILKARYAVEKYISVMQSNVYKFNDNWMPYSSLLETED